MARLAWFTPWPPQRSGVGGRSAEVVPLLAARGHAIDVFVDERFVPLVPRVAADPPAPGAVRVLGAHDVIWRSALGHYDAPVYQLGNSSVHDFTWPYLFQWPGLVVLHDARLHHARALTLLGRRRLDDYRSEFAFNHPDIRPEAAALAVRGFHGTYAYGWPMLRSVIEASRLVAAHARGVVDEIRETWPDRPVEYIALGEGTSPEPEARARFRASIGLSESAVVFGVFGALTAEKRVPQILRAFAATHARVPEARLVLAGWPDPQTGIDELARTLGIHDAIHVAQGLENAAFDDAIAAMDVCLCLRWPTARETSGPWLRAIAAGRATVITDLVHQGHIPTLDPRTWHRHAPVGDSPLDADSRAVAVAVDILDENHSLRLAMYRLAKDADLRRDLGARAQAYWRDEHTVDRMVADYDRALTRLLTLVPPTSALPEHLRPDPLARARDILAPFGLTVPF